MRRSRRRYTEEFKNQAIEACLQPGISMASVALANGLNANLLRRWVTERQEEAAADSEVSGSSAFVPDRED
jgi:transposase-like protein